MTIFDYISDILFTKKKNLLNTVDEESEFTPFLVNRWLSMYSTSVAQDCNIINKYLSIFDSKKELYSLFHAVFLKHPSRKINYFKRTKSEKTEDDGLVQRIAASKELSQREIKEYLNTLNCEPTQLK
jgi:hypothetical protein